MALTKHVVQLPIDKGLSTKTDDKQQPTGYLTRAENVVYETLAKLRKRNGYDKLPQTGIEGTVLQILRYKNELLALTATKLYSYSSSLERWFSRGPIYASSTRTNIVVKNSSSQEQVDSVVIEDFRVTVWADADANVRYSVQDLSTNGFVVANALVDAGERPVLGYINNVAYVIYGSAANLKFKSFSIVNPGTLSSATTVASNRHLTTGLIDATSTANKILVAYNSTGSAADLKLFSINSDGTTSSIVGTTGATASRALDVYVDAGNRIVILYSNGTALKTVIYPYTLNSALLGATTIEQVPGAAATAALNLNADITLTSVAAGTPRNTTTFTIQVLAAAANPTNTVLVTFSGTSAAITVTVTPNDGTNNAATPVDLTTANLVQLINTGLVTGKNITLTDSSSLRALQTATGGDTTALADGGEGDGVVGTFSGGTDLPVTSACSIQTSTGYKIYYEVEQASAANYVKQADLTLAGVVSNKAVFKRSVGLAARVFKHGDIRYVPVVHESSLQSSFFLLDESGYAVTKFANQTAGSVLDSGVLPTVSAIDATSYNIPGLFRNRLKTEDGTYFSTTGVLAATIDFDPENPYSNAELADNLHICAGLLKVYDGSTIVEHGFNVYPETLSQASTATSGGSMSDGVYAYKAVYRWTDNAGKDHMSAPTPTSLQVTLSGGGNTQTNVVTVPTLRLTDKTDVVIDIYRTENAGTEYYKITSDLSPLENDTTVDTLNFTDTLSDADLIDNEALYTTGGVLENIAPSAAFQVAVIGGERLAIIGEDSNRVVYSKIVQEGTPVEFSDVIYRDCDPVGGPLTALRYMAEKTVIFSEGAIFYIAGEGPNNLGQQDTFTKPDTIATDIGCTSPSSLVLLPTGLMFKSRKGIWHLNGGLQLEYKGDRVEAYNSATVTSAAIVGELNQVRFLLSESTALVYNYNLDRWSTFENHGGVSSITIGADYYYVREDGSIYKENRTSFSDNSSPIKLRIETGWLSFAQLQNYQRAYRAMLLGDYKSEHKLRIKVAYDFVNAWVQEVLLNSTDFIDPSIYGEDSPYGAGSPYGGDQSLYQARIDFARQKCQSLRLLIEDSQADTGEGLSLSAITLRAGVKAGMGQVGSGNSFGTN